MVHLIDEQRTMRCVKTPAAKAPFPKELSAQLTEDFCSERARRILRRLRAAPPLEKEVFGAFYPSLGYHSVNVDYYEVHELRKKITYYVLSEDIPLNGRLFNLLNAISILYIVISIFTSSDSTFVLLGFLVGAIALLIRTNITGQYKLGSNIFVIGVGFVFFPFLFILNDGVSGGIPFFMVFGAIMICLLLQGRNCAIVLSLYLAATVFCIAFDYYHAENDLNIMLPFSSELSRYFYIALSLIICSIMSGIIIRYQNMLYVREKKKAEKASQAKGDFLAHMSHEIRTPMNAIIGLTAIAKSADTPEGKDYALKRIGDASQQLLGIINDILDISKIEANKMELSPATFTFEHMLQKVVNVIAFRAEEKRISIAVHIDDKIPRALRADDQRLSQVITNLLSNAVKFTPENGSIHINTKFVEEKKDICTLQIEVSDTGIGISAEQQARLFTSFEQAEQNTARNFGGTGLGLAISKRIVEMMGGKIWIQSEAGQGSTFAFTIQAKRGADKQAYRHVDWSGLRVLVADDAPDILDYFREIAARLGFQCDTAPSGYEAVQFLENDNTYDIFFIDWMMPGMAGPELAGYIKRNSTNKPVVVIISATEWSLIEREAKNAGVDRFIQKPLFPSSIADCISECLGLDKSLAAEETKDLPTGDFKGRRALLAEDVAINREIVLALLEPTLLEIDCAENGEEAVKRFTESPERYDIIFMDVQMPVMDGYEATRQIRSLSTDAAKNVPIIAMTANVFREDVDKCLQAGMNDHLGKPLDLDDVLKKLHEHLPAQQVSAV